MHQIGPSSWLVDDKAFYRQKGYKETTINEFAQAKALPPIYYEITGEKTSWYILKLFLSCIFFPIGIFKLIHVAIGKLAMIPASSFSLFRMEKNYPKRLRTHDFEMQDEWKVKRISIKVGKYIVDGAIVGTEKTLGNGRWLIRANGNMECYEEKLRPNSSFHDILRESQSNGVIFNYPGVGASTGLPTRGALTRTYEGVLRFVEDKEKGIGANQIIAFGHSIGAAIQLESAEKHTFKKEIQYVFVESRTFSDIFSLVAQMAGRALAYLARFFGWDFSPKESSKKLSVPELVLQSANVQTYTELTSDPDQITDDGIVPGKASLGYSILSDEKRSLENKTVVGISEWHNEPISNPTHLAHLIQNHLQ